MAAAERAHWSSSWLALLPLDAGGRCCSCAWPGSTPAPTQVPAAAAACTEPSPPPAAGAPRLAGCGRRRAQRLRSGQTLAGPRGTAAAAAAPAGALAAGPAAGGLRFVASALLRSRKPEASKAWQAHRLLPAWAACAGSSGAGWQGDLRSACGTSAVQPLTEMACWISVGGHDDRPLSQARAQLAGPDKECWAQHLGQRAEPKVPAIGQLPAVQRRRARVSDHAQRQQICGCRCGGSWLRCLLCRHSIGQVGAFPATPGLLSRAGPVHFSCMQVMRRPLAAPRLTACQAPIWTSWAACAPGPALARLSPVCRPA